MLYRPAAAVVASFKGSVKTTCGPCCSHAGSVPVAWRNDHGGGQMSPKLRHLQGCSVDFSAVRSGDSAMGCSKAVLPLLSVFSQRGGSLDARAMAVATQAGASAMPSIMLPAWEASPAIALVGSLEAESLGAREPEAGSAVEESGENGGVCEGSASGRTGNAREEETEAATTAEARDIEEGNSLRDGEGVGAATTVHPGARKPHPNKGRMPWNKGKRHSPETIARIRQRTIEAMCDPAIRAKLRSYAMNQRCSDETKAKIRASISANWGSKKLLRLAQDSCVNDWRRTVAEAARKGGKGEEEMEWDSYRKIARQLLTEERRRLKALKKGSQLKSTKQVKRESSLAGSEEHRQKISEAIRAKWNDPEYRRKVSEGLQRFVREKTSARARPSPRRKRVSVPPSIPCIRKDPDDAPKEATPMSKPKESQKAVAEKPRVVTFVDPQANAKLERIRRMQSARQMMELRKIEASERARLLMAEAEKAAKALEAVAATDEAARLSLAETRRLLAEAADKIRTAESRR